MIIKNSKLILIILLKYIYIFEMKYCMDMVKSLKEKESEKGVK